MHAIAVVQMDTLTVQPQEEAAFLPDWEEQVREVLTRFSRDFNTAEQPFTEERKGAILEHLLNASRDFPDLLYMPLPGKNVMKISGSSATVQSVIDILNNIVETEEEITLDASFSPKQADYVMKFAKHEIDEIVPPVHLVKDPAAPEKITVRGLKKSLDKLKSIAHEKLVQSHREIIPLSVAAHRLLASKRGTTKMEEHLGDAAKYVLYGLEKLERSAQVFIMAPRDYDCKHAREKIEALVYEKMIPLSSDKRTICSGSTQEWRVLVEKLHSEHFVAVRVDGDQVVIVGEEAVVPGIVEQVEQFVMEQGAITATFDLKAAEWQIVREVKSISRKLTALRDDCKKQRVRFSFPSSDGRSSLVSIELHGDPVAVEGAKGRLFLLVQEIKSREVIIPPQPGLDKICGQMSMKCKELQDQHKVVIEQEFKESTTSGQPLIGHGTSGSGKKPTCLLTGMNEFGTKVSIYDGDYTKKGCDVLVNFVTPKATYDAPVVSSLVRVGGAEVKRAVDAIYKGHPFSGTVKPSASGSLSCSQIMHAVIPVYMDGKEREVNYLDSVLQQIFQGATPSSSNSILITPITSYPCNYPIELYSQRLLQVIQQSQPQFGMYSVDITIMVFVEDATHKAVFQECMNQWDYTISFGGQRVAPCPPVSLPMSPQQASGPSQHKAHVVDSLASVVKITKGSMLDVQVCQQYSTLQNPFCALDFTVFVLPHLLG